MDKRKIFTVALAILIIPILRAAPASAQGDQIVPHVVNGLDANAQLTYRTKFDITNLTPNLSPNPSPPAITKAKVLFYYANGTPWALATDQGTVSEVPLNLGAYQTLRITTLGNGNFAHGYVVVRNQEGTSTYSQDNQLAVTVYYEVLSAGRVIETVSVPLGQPTVTWSFPVEIDSSKRLNTGFAIVNLSSQQNEVQLQMYQASTPTSDVAAKFAAQPVKLPLNGNEKQARMLTEFFPTATSFRGILKANSQGPVAILALELTPVAAGSQYATMVPTYFDSLRHNTFVYLPQGYALDADLAVVDYFHSEDDNVDQDLETPWDVLLRTLQGTPTGSVRGLVPQQGATLCRVGNNYDGSTFDAITQDYLRSLNYTSDTIDISDNSANLKVGFTFAIRTALGRYVKVRVRDWVGYSASAYQDLLLEVFVYK